MWALKGIEIPLPDFVRPKPLHIRGFCLFGSGEPKEPGEKTNKADEPYRAYRANEHDRPNGTNRADKPYRAYGTKGIHDYNRKNHIALPLRGP